MYFFFFFYSILSKSIKVPDTRSSFIVFFSIVIVYSRLEREPAGARIRARSYDYY